MGSLYPAISDNEMTGWIEEAFGADLPPSR